MLLKKILPLSFPCFLQHLQQRSRRRAIGQLSRRRHAIGQIPA